MECFYCNNDSNTTMEMSENVRKWLVKGKVRKHKVFYDDFILTFLITISKHQFYLNHISVKFPLFACYYSRDTNKLLKLPAPKP